MSSIVNIRMERDLLAELDNLAKIKHLARTDVIRGLLIDGLKHEKMALASEKYAKGELTMEQSARFAGVSIYDMIEHTNEFGITKHEDAEELKRIAKRTFETKGMKKVARKL